MLATPGLTPTTPGLSTPGLTSPGLTPGLSTPGAVDPTTGAGGLSSPSELPISDPVGLDPSGGTYPILGDPSLGAAPAPSGGLVSDVMSAANQLGAGQAIDLLKGMILPGLTQAAHGAAAPVPPPRRFPDRTPGSAFPETAPQKWDPGLTGATQTLRCRAVRHSLCSLK